MISRPFCLACFCLIFGSGQIVAQTTTVNLNQLLAEAPAIPIETWEVPARKVSTSVGAYRVIYGQLFDLSRYSISEGEVFDPAGAFGKATNSKGQYRIEVPANLKQLRFAAPDMDGASIDLDEEENLNVVLLAYGGHGINPLLETVQYTRPSDRQYAIKVKGTIKVNAAPNDHSRPYVRIEGTNTKVYTDASGHFEIMAPPGRDILSFEYQNLPARKVALPEVQSVFIPVNLWPAREGGDK